MTFWYKKPNEPDTWNKRPIIVDKKSDCEATSDCDDSEPET